MEAKLKTDYPQSKIRALEGREYVKYEYRPVPVEREDEAQKHPNLDTRGDLTPPEPPAAVPEFQEIISSPAPTAIALRRMNRAELQQAAHSAGLPLVGDENKAELLDSLLAHYNLEG